MKQMIIRSLLDAYYHEGRYVSGALLSEQLGVTRAAISKAIQQLVVNGYPIESQKHHGYRLTKLPSQLSEPLISRSLQAEGALRFAQSVHWQPSVDSTNLVARRGADAGEPPFSLYLADEQTSGRGRRGRIWHSAAGGGVWFSLLLKPDVQPDQLASITLFAGLSMAAALRSLTALDVQLKWPNDLVVLPAGRKLGGILTETVLEENRVSAVVIGIGINITTEEFPDELNAIATSLAIESVRTGSKVPTRLDVLLACLSEFEQRWTDWLAGTVAEKSSSSQSQDLPAWIQDYRAICATLGRDVQIISASGQTLFAKAIDLSAGGDLIVRLADGTQQTISAGEVSVRGLLGYV